MNKKYQQFVPWSLVFAAVVVLVVLFFVSKPKIEEYNNVRLEVAQNNEQRKKLEEQIKQEESEKQAQEIKLRALKPIFKSKVKGNENLGVFGDMFENIIKVAQSNGLLIRSIEYNMKPTNDPLYKENSDSYNACELKFFFIGTYSQLQSFLIDMNNNFEYLISLSGLSISSFPENQDYLLINQIITVYSEKPVEQSQNSGGFM